MRCLACLLILTAVSGCQYERSFLNMDSNSGVPFLGLQMSVDASDAQQQQDPEKAIQLVSNLADEPVVTNKAETTRAQSPDWAFLSASPKPPAEFPNPLADVETDEHPLTTVGRRLAAF